MRRSPAVAAPLHRPAVSTPMRRALAWLLMLAVLFGQGLGAVHSVSHGVPGTGPHAHARAHDAQAHPHAHVPVNPRVGLQAMLQAPPAALFALHAHGPACDHGDAPGLQALFGHAEDEPGCRLYDQLLLAGPLMPVSAVLALPTSSRVPPPPGVGVLLAAPAAAYQARGPPRG